MECKVVHSWDELLQVLSAGSHEGCENLQVAARGDMPIRMSLSLSAAFAMNRSLLELTLTVDARAALGLQGLGQNTTLRHLSLHVLHWGAYGELGRAVAAVLKQNSSLQSLCLKADGTNLSDKTGVVLAQALTQNSFLSSMSFSTQETSVGDETGTAMAEALWLNDMRHFLWAAGRTTIGDATGRSLAQAAQQNCNLHSFNFSANGTEVSDESGIALASILSMNSALQKFSFEACKTEISDSTGTAIAGSLCSNSSLRSFSFVANSCNISDETCQAMAESIGSTCLTSVDFVALHVFVSEKTIMCLQNALHRNRGLQFVRFETSQDGSACVTVREVLGKAMHKDQVRCEHKQNLGSAYPSYPCFQVPSLAQSFGKDFLETSLSHSSDWGSAIVIESEHGEDMVLRSGKLSCADSLSETDVGDAEAVTTASTEAPIWESFGV